MKIIYLLYNGFTRLIISKLIGKNKLNELITPETRWSNYEIFIESISECRIILKLFIISSEKPIESGYSWFSTKII